MQSEIYASAISHKGKTVFAITMKGSDEYANTLYANVKINSIDDYQWNYFGTCLAPMLLISK